MLRPENNYYFLSSISSMRFLFFFIFLFLVSSCNYQTKENSSEHDMMSHNSQKNSFGTGNFSIETDFIDERNESSIVNLSNNDTYDLTIGAIGTKIGWLPITMLAYNQSIPWPALRVPVGSKIIFHVKNLIKNLPETLHPHGVRTDWKWDGVLKIHGWAHEPILYGETDTYEITFPDTGIYWYHPHIARDDIAQEYGLYGTILVYNPNEKVQYTTETIITLDDIALSQNGILPFWVDSIDHTIMGRYGDTFLINGKENPTFSFTPKNIHRIYLVNPSNARPYNVFFSWAQMKMIGSDGWEYGKEYMTTWVIVWPGERATVDVYYESTGSYEFFTNNEKKDISLAKIEIKDSLIQSPSALTRFSQIESNKKMFDTMQSWTVLSDIVDKYSSQKPDKILSIHMEMMGMNMGNMEETHTWAIEWEDTMKQMNQMHTDKQVLWKLTDEISGKSNMDIDWKFKKNSYVVLQVKNPLNSSHPMQHPFHIHGQRFLVLTSNQTKNENPVWKDTVLISAGWEVNLLIDMSNPGTWPAHCHTLEHMLSGMMFHFTVE